MAATCSAWTEILYLSNNSYESYCTVKGQRKSSLSYNNTIRAHVYKLWQTAVLHGLYKCPNSRVNSVGLVEVQRLH